MAAVNQRPTAARTVPVLDCLDQWENGTEAAGFLGAAHFAAALDTPNSLAVAADMDAGIDVVNSSGLAGIAGVDIDVVDRMADNACDAVLLLAMRDRRSRNLCLPACFASVPAVETGMADMAADPAHTADTVDVAADPVDTAGIAVLAADPVDTVGTAVVAADPVQIAG
jgi:hypothetical protein